MDELRVAIRVRPGASRSSVGGAYGDSLVVRVCERAVDGKATEAALRAVAEALGARRRDVRLLGEVWAARKLATGAASRDKLVAVPDTAEARTRLAALLRPDGGGDSPRSAPDE